MRTNVPAIPINNQINYKEIHQKAKENTQGRTNKAKRYADNKRRAKEAKLELGDVVLVKQQKKNKFTTPFHPKPLKVIAIKGTMVTAKRADKEIRNISHFKKFIGNSQQNNYREQVCSDSESDDETPVQPRIRQQQDVPRIYPRRQRMRPRYFDVQNFVGDSKD